MTEAAPTFRGPVRAAGAAVLAAALALRLAHVLTIGDYPLFDVLSLDAESYDRWARAIAGGEWARGRPFYQAPLYAYFLACLHGLTGGDLLAPRIANALLGTLHVGLVMRLGARAFGPSAGVLAAALCAVHGTFLFEEGKVMKTTLGLVLGTGTLVLFGEARARAAAGRAWLWIAAGLAGAGAALVRENFLLFVLAMIAFTAWRRPGGSWRPAGALALGAVAGLLPSTLHNARYHGEIQPITSQAGQNFYTGVHPGNPHGGYLVPDFVRRSPRFEEIDFAAEAERRAGRELTPGEVSSYWFRQGLRHLADEPGRLPVLFVRKLGLLFHDFEIPDDEDVRFFRRYAPVLRLPLPGFGILAVLGLAGLGLALLRRRAPPELVVFLVVYPVSVALFFVFSRYRLPMVAPLAVFAAYFLREGWSAASARRWRPVLIGAAACLPLAALLHRPLDVSYTFATSHLSLGIAHEVKGRFDDALQEYRRGLELDPGDPKLLRRAARLASDRVGRGADPAGTITLLQRAVAANPDDTELRFRLGTLLGAAGRLEDAVAAFGHLLRAGDPPPGVHANLAIAHDLLGNPDAARRHAEAALRENPEDREMRTMLERLGG